MEYTIFMSHSAADRPWVEWLASNAQQQLGIKSYLFEHDPQPGTYISEKVKAQIRSSDAVVVFVTANSQYSPYVQQEIGFAEASGKLIIPLVQPGIDRRCLAMLEGREHIPFDFHRPENVLNTFLTSLYRLTAAKQLQEQQRATALLGFGFLILLALLDRK
jgi:hypothetical protein